MSFIDEELSIISGSIQSGTTRPENLEELRAFAWPPGMMPTSGGVGILLQEAASAGDDGPLPRVGAGDGGPLLRVVAAHYIDAPIRGFSRWKRTAVQRIRSKPSRRLQLLLSDGSNEVIATLSRRATRRAGYRPGFILRIREWYVETDGMRTVVHITGHDLLGSVEAIFDLA
jgi:hypothetical protein